MVEQERTQEQFGYDSVAGPVYAFRLVDEAKASSLAAGRDLPQIVEVLVCPYPEPQDRRPELRRYYALNLPQAVARATEIEIRLREQELRAALISRRPASKDETEMFFRAMGALETAMPGPIADHSQGHQRDRTIPVAAKRAVAVFVGTGMSMTEDTGGDRTTQ